LATRLSATICYDAIGGSIAGVILKCMPKKSTLYVYGLLSGESLSNIDGGDMLYGHKSVSGLFLGNWLEEKGTIKLLPSFFRLRKLLMSELKSEIAVECSLEEFETSLKDYLANMTKGKVVVKPHS
jgi:NADPH:quinone reductase